VSRFNQHEWADPVRIHHVAVFVADTERSLRLYRDLLGFRVLIDMEIPDGEMFTQATLDDIFKVQGGRSRMVILQSSDGTVLELQEPSTPAIERTPDEHLRYGATGISELAFAVEDIDGWFERVRAAGYETQTDYIWDYGTGRSFLFYDPDGAMLQFNQEEPGRA
jgi:catechol 2,3-dioxygenase-like lactoylglutathione lyase family enzyme